MTLLNQINQEINKPDHDIIYFIVCKDEQSIIATLNEVYDALEDKVLVDRWDSLVIKGAKSALSLNFIPPKEYRKQEIQKFKSFFMRLDVDQPGYQLKKRINTVGGTEGGRAN